MLISAPQILGYQLTEKLHIGSRTLVYRAIRVNDALPVVIKFLRQEYPTFSELVQFRNQYTIARSLEIASIIKPYSLEPYKNGYALVMEDFGGISLSQYIQAQSLTVDRFLPIAIQMTEILNQLHQQRVIHKDIKTANVLIHPIGEQIKFIDFSIASLLPKETQEVKSPNVLEGTLAYISPEQTGRMNRGIDYRSDYYSLGVTFYELLTGKLPFEAQEALELIHCHMAQNPPPLQELNPQISPVLSEIVMKLMAKNAEDRYQSALGLKYDLEKCWHQLKSTNQIAHFAIAQRDLSDRFLIPEQLYGRQTEVKALLDAFERVTQGTTELMLVAGFSGIGKTAVINEVHKPIIRQRGYFIKGKYDQYNRNIPFSAFVQAFRDLIKQLLSESSQQLTTWKSKILQAVGENGQIIIEVIPELERLIGKQPPAVELSGSAVQNRFNLVFQKFVEVFTSEDHPLVIFLDDLQWADSASLKLLQLLMNDAGHLLILGAYRDNEVSSAHPFILTVNELEKAGARISTLTLQPLSQEDINYLVADTLSCDRTLAQPLTELVYLKAKGNPFFTTQFLKALHEDRFIQFNPDARYWQCDISQIKVQSLTDDVVEFMAKQLQKLSLETQSVLKLAACIGAQFDLHTLAIVSEQSELDAATAIWQALQEGLIVPLSETYKFFQEETGGSTTTPQIAVPYRFLHDRVQQAAYSLIPESQKQATHLKIGQLLLKTTPQTALEESIFDIVNQLNMGVDLIAEQSDRDRLASLNLLAGKKAKAATAYEAAIRYLSIGLGLLGTHSWQTQYDLTLSIHVEAAEAEYLNSNFQRLEVLGQIVLHEAKTLLDKVKIYELQIQSYQAQSTMLKAIDRGLEALEALGIDLSVMVRDRPMPELPRMEDLERIPEMTDPYQLAALRILMSIYPPVYIAKPEMMPAVILTLINLCLEGGNSGLAAYPYVLYGMLLCKDKGGIENGYHSGQLALRLLEQFNATSLKAKIYTLYNAHIRLWKEPARATLSAYLEGFQSGLETGDIEWASYLCMHYCKNLFWTGEPLQTAEQQQEPYLEFLQKSKHDFALSYAKIWMQLNLNLQGKAKDTLQLIGDNFDEKSSVKLWQDTNNYMSLFALYVGKMSLLYLFREEDSALEYALWATEHTEAAIGLITIGAYNFYYSLILLALYPHAEVETQRQYMAVVTENQEKMQEWATHAPSNYQHKYYLVEAEKSRVLGQDLQAMADYDRAIQDAKNSGYIQEEALANELAAEFYLSLDREKIAKTYITEAYYCYSRWGAKAKTEALEKTYPYLLSSVLHNQQDRQFHLHETYFSTFESSSTFSQTLQSGFSSSSSSNVYFLDFATLLKTSQVLSSAIQLDQLLSTLVQVLMENAGADKGSLILLKEDRLVIEATAVLGDVNQTSVLQSIPLESSQELPISIINYVFHTQETLVLDREMPLTSLASDAYIQRQRPKSLLCTPIVYQGKLIGILYLENNLTAGVFTQDRLQILQVLMTQAAISLENAKLYNQLEEYSYRLEQKVEERTQELKEKATQLESTLEKLYSTQSQLIQTEKMSSLGQLVAGVAHEINNPINFIFGNLTHAREYICALIDLIELYGQIYPQPQPEIQAKKEDIDLEFLVEDLPLLLASMRSGSDRIRQIVDSLRNFSRLDEAELKQVDIHSGLDSTLLILQHRLKAGSGHQEIKTIREYGQLPLVNCYASLLNQVFINILSNGVDALRQAEEKSSQWHRQPTLWIRTALKGDSHVLIHLADNGLGMEESVLKRIFEPFFTTKPVGSGTGLGLSISYSIIVEQHRGNLSCISTPGEGTEFTIEIPIE